MSLSLYDVTVPVFLRSFANLREILEKGRTFADQNGMPHAELLEARLFPDMAPLTGQIQRASDTAKFVGVRVGQVETVSMEDNETSFNDLQARINATVAFLKAIPADSFAGREEAQVELRTGGGTKTFTARNYVLGFAIPNFFFHATTAYDILRHKGVPLGKLDYLGRE